MPMQVFKQLKLDDCGGGSASCMQQCIISTFCISTITDSWSCRDSLKMTNSEVTIPHKDTCAQDCTSIE